MKKVIAIVCVCAIIIVGIILGIKVGNKNDKPVPVSGTNTTTETIKNNTTAETTENNTTNTQSSSSNMSDTDYYEKAAEFVKNEIIKEEDHINTKKDYNKFVEYDGFGVNKENGVVYAYMWIVDSSYYTENDKVQQGPGSSMAYKIKFENGEPVKYENPTDGAGQEESIKKMFPSDVAKKVLNYNFDFTRLDNAVKNYYKK